MMEEILIHLMYGKVMVIFEFFLMNHLKVLLMNYQVYHQLFYELYLNFVKMINVMLMMKMKISLLILLNLLMLMLLYLIKMMHNHSMLMMILMDKQLNFFFVGLLLLKCILFILSISSVISQKHKRLSCPTDPIR